MLAQSHLESRYCMPPLATKFVDKLWVGSVYTVFNLSQTELYPSYISLLCPHERPPLWGVDIPHNPVHVVQGCSGPQDMRKQPLEQSKGLWSKQSTRKKNENYQNRVGGPRVHTILKSTAADFFNFFLYFCRDRWPDQRVGSREGKGGPCSTWKISLNSHLSPSRSRLFGISSPRST